MLALLVENDTIREEIISGSCRQVVICQKNVIFICTDGCWHLKLPFDLIYVNKAPIKEGSQIALKLRNEDKYCDIFFYDEPLHHYQKYVLPSLLSIGLEKENHFIYSEKVLIDTNMRTLRTTSAYVSLNGKRVHEATYHPGNILQVKELRMILGTDFLMIRDADIEVHLPFYKASLSSRRISKFTIRYKEMIEETSLPEKVDWPHAEHVQKRLETNMFSTLLPSIMMLSSLFLLGIFTTVHSLSQGRALLDVLSSALMPGIMLLTTIVGHPLAAQMDKRKYHRDTQKRNAAYLAIIERVCQDLLMQRRQYMYCRFQNYPSCRMILHDIENGMLPQRHEQILAGWYQHSISMNSKLSDEREVDEDILTIQRVMEERLQRPVQDLLLIDKNVRIEIEGEQKTSLFLSLLIQAGLYQEHVILKTDETFLNKFPFLCRIPGICCRIGSTLEEADSDYFAKDSMVFLSQTCIQLPVHWISLVKQKNPDIIIHAGSSNWYWQKDTGRKWKIKSNLFCDDFPDTVLPVIHSCSKNPISFLDLYHVNDAKELEVLERWQNNDDMNGLVACLGADSSENLISIDLSEAKQGPHGLIAGTTGSGKSELILTMLLSLMVNYSPQRVQIAFIDFKGGSAVNALNVNGLSVPHLVGSLSNLEPGEQERVLYALKNECLRRQRLLLSAARKTHCTVMNLTDYRLAEKKCANLPYLADLIVVVDEFAELKTQNYEMLGQLISIARIGRSLGIHLILSTQKPAGIVNDQIWSNSHFKICLRVSEKQDSMEILHSDDAMSLTKAGEFVLVCDSLKERGVCGYSGYRKSLQKMQMNLLGMDGKCIDTYSSYGEFAEPQIRSIIQQIQYAWKGASMKPLWLPPIKKCSYEDAIKMNSFGMIDDFYHQKQEYCQYHFHSGEHWAFMCSDRTVKKRVLELAVDLLHKKNISVVLWDDLHLDAEMNHKVDVSTSSETADENVISIIQNQKNQKVVIVTDAGRMNAGRFPMLMHELLEQSQEHNVQLICFLSQSASLPYRDNCRFLHKICLKNNNKEDMSSFLGVRVKNAIQENDAGIVYQEHLLNLRLGIRKEENDASYLLGDHYDTEILQN